MSAKSTAEVSAWRRDARKAASQRKPVTRQRGVLLINVLPRTLHEPSYQSRPNAESSYAESSDTTRLISSCAEHGQCKRRHTPGALVKAPRECAPCPKTPDSSDCALAAGTTSATRSSAAAAIGEIGSAHPAQLPALLRQVSAACSYAPTRLTALLTAASAAGRRQVGDARRSRRGSVCSGRRCASPLLAAQRRRRLRPLASQPALPYAPLPLDPHPCLTRTLCQATACFRWLAST